MEQVELDTVGKMENEGFSEAQMRDNPNNKANYVPMGYNATGETECVVLRQTYLHQSEAVRYTPCHLVCLNASSKY